ncbi:MAG: SUMF1/EgtB/PvdO family nonheme iron enzyme, partial [Pseudomonadota bacterium]
MSHKLMLQAAATAAFFLLAAMRVDAQPFRDCSDCPEMIEIPSGTATLGAEPYEANTKAGDLPLREVTIAYRLAVAKTEVTQAQYRAFMEASGHQMSQLGCNTWNVNRIMGYVRAHTWEAPGYPQNDSHPVVCVSHEDATAYASGLADKTGKPYRLLSSTEF